jgi:hypothetical protein
VTLIPSLADYKPGLLDGLWVRTTGKSWWQALYTDGHMVSEWQTLANPNDPESGRWEERNAVGLRTLILLCPTGKAYRLTSGEDNKLFQFKLAYQTPGIGNITDLQLIGVVINTEGDCVCFAWERQERRAVKITDNVLNMQYHAIGALGLANLRLKF